MRFVVDEGVSPRVVKSLRKHGHDVVYIAEMSQGSLDNVVLEFANSDQRILMTRDKDFGKLVFRNKMIHSGIILNRIYQLSSANRAKLVLNVIEKYQDELMGAFTVILPHKVRIRKF